MAVAIPNQWQGVFADQDKEIVTNPTAGRMMVAVIASRVLDNSAPLLNVGDVSRNYWQLLYDPFRFATSPNAAAQLQVEIWGCPAVRFDGWPVELVYASAMQISAFDVGSVCVNVVEVSGVTGSVTVDSVTPGTATGTTSLAIAVPAPTGAANCLMIGAAVADVNTAPTPSGTGWTALSGVTDTAPNVGLASAWREATTGGTVTFTLGTSQNWAGVAVAIRTAGSTPAQPNPNWPAVEFLLGLGYDLSTPLSRVAFTNQTKRLKSLTGDRGIQAELGTATQGATDILLDNRDGAFTPRTAGSATANAAGTTSTIKIPDAQATNIFKGDFFRLAASTGALKQLAVFQVSGTASAGGTTTITFARADGTGLAAAATASGDLYVGVPIDAYIPYRLVMTWNSQPYVVSSGWLRDIPIVYDGAAYSEAQAVGTDVLETLTAANPSALRGEILRRNPTHYWPLDDAAGSGYAANLSGNSTAVLTQTVSKYGAGANVTADFGATTQDVLIAGSLTQSLIGDNGTGWSSDGQTSAEVTQKGYALVGAGVPDFPPISGGVTIFGFLLNTVAQDAVIQGASVNPTLCVLRNTDPAAGVGQGAVIKLSVSTTSQYAQVTVWDKSTHAATTTTATANGLGNGTWTLTFDQTSFAVYVNTNLVLSGSANLVSAFSGIDIGGEADQFFHGRCFPGTHAHVAVFGRKLTFGEIAYITQAALYGEPTGSSLLSARITRKLNTVGWQGARVVNTSDASLGAEDAPSGSVVDIVSEIAGYRDGLVFPDGAGQLQHRDRPLAAQQSPRATLGENTAGGEIPYQPGMSPSFTPAWIYGNVRVDNTSNAALLSHPQTTSVVAVDDTSSKKYGQRTLPRSTRFKDTYRAWDIAWWYLAKYAYPQKRVETIVIDAKADPTRWPFVLGVEVGDLVTVAKRHLGAPAYTIRCVVLRVQPKVIFGDDTSGSATLTLGAATLPVTVLNDPVVGIVGDTIMGV